MIWVSIASSLIMVIAIVTWAYPEIEDWVDAKIRSLRGLRPVRGFKQGRVVNGRFHFPWRHK